MKPDGRSERATLIREQKRAVLLDAALRVFGDKGYHAASIGDIVEAAGVARGTFYLYFESKDVVFLALVDDLLAKLRADVVGVDLEGDIPPIEAQLVRMICTILESVRRNRALTRIVFREAIGLHTEVDGRMRSFYEELRHFARMSLDIGRSLAFVRDVDTELVATCIVGSVKQVVEDHLIDGEASAFDVERWAAAIVDYNLRGVVARKQS